MNNIPAKFLSKDELQSKLLKVFLQLQQANFTLQKLGYYEVDKDNHIQEQRSLQSTNFSLTVVKRLFSKHWTEVLTLVSQSTSVPANVPSTLKSAYQLIKCSGIFDEKYYLNEYPDVAAAGVDPLLHYLKFGCNERRSVSAQFNVVRYQDRYSDIAKSGQNPILHFINIGLPEGRSDGSTND